MVDIHFIVRITPNQGTIIITEIFEGEEGASLAEKNAAFLFQKAGHDLIERLAAEAGVRIEHQMVLDNRGLN